MRSGGAWAGVGGCGLVRRVRHDVIVRDIDARAVLSRRRKLSRRTKPSDNLAASVGACANVVAVVGEAGTRKLALPPRGPRRVATRRGPGRRAPRSASTLPNA